MTARDRPDGDYAHTCDKCGERFSGYKRDVLCMVCLPMVGPGALPAEPCPCQSPRRCILCARTTPCGLQGPDAKLGDAPICTMEPETYAELVARVKAAYAAMGRLREDAARLDYLDTLPQKHGWDGWEVLPGEGLVMSNAGGTIREAVDRAMEAD